MDNNTDRARFGFQLSATLALSVAASVVAVVVVSQLAKISSSLTELKELARQS